MSSGAVSRGHLLGMVVHRVLPPVLTYALVVVFVGLATVIGVDQSVVVPALINVVLVLALYLFSGNSGIFSFGHIGFMAIGAYTGAILSIPHETKALLYEMPRWLEIAHVPAAFAIVLAAVVAALAAVLFGLPILRLSGIAASIGTFAFLVITHTVSQNLQPITNGQSGITAVPKTVGQLTLLIVIALTLVIVYVFQESGTGLRLRASREDDVAASAAGIRIRRERRVAWVLSAAIAGAGGALYASFFGTIAPDSFYLDQTFLIVAMLVIGGSRSMSGAVSGALVLAAVSELIRRLGAGISIGSLAIPSFAELTPVLLALFMLLVLILRPAGLTRSKEFAIPGPRKRVPGDVPARSATT